MTNHADESTKPGSATSRDDLAQAIYTAVVGVNYKPWKGHSEDRWNSALDAADAVTPIVADAWDKGYTAGYEAIADMFHGRQITTNPYRP